MLVLSTVGSFYCWLFLQLVLSTVGSFYCWFRLLLVLSTIGSFYSWFFLLLVLSNVGSFYCWFLLLLALSTVGSFYCWFFLLGVCAREKKFPLREIKITGLIDMIYNNPHMRCISCCLNICSHNGVSATKWIMGRYNPCAEYIYT